MKINKSQIKYRFNQLANSNVHQLYIYDEVTAYGDFNWDTWQYDDSETSANFFRENLNSISDSDKIELYVNSCGGSVKEGIAIYNMLKRKACEKTCYIDGFAYSVASVICLACDKVVMGLGTSMMIHDMWMTVSGNARELRKQADDLDILMEANRKIYMERAKNLTEEQLKSMMEAETILTPEQCLEYGFCDEIATNAEGVNKVIQQQATIIKQMKKDNAIQMSLREEMKSFLQKNIKEPKQQESTPIPPKEEPVVNQWGSFLNAINK